MQKVDLVLLHAPSVYDFRERSIMFGPVSDMVPSSPIFEMYPLGFTTMAEYMERHGLRVRIVNLAVLMLNKPNFDVEAYLAKLDPVAFGIDLHWLPHAHGSIEVARVVKKLHPNTPVIFGGLSATLLPRGAHHLRRRGLRGARRLDRRADHAPHEGAQGRRRLRRHPQRHLEGRLRAPSWSTSCRGCRPT